MVGLGEAHREIDGGVIRHGEVEDLGRAGGQQREHRRGLPRQALVEAVGQHPADLAEAAEGREGDGPCERGVARFEAFGAQGGGQRLVEGGGALLPDHSATACAAARLAPSPAAS